jgi:hypothetical protein
MAAHRTNAGRRAIADSTVTPRVLQFEHITMKMAKKFAEVVAG